MEAAEVPDEFVCPITQELMGHPAVISSGHTFERSAILAWLKTRNTCPLTNAKLRSVEVTTNWNLKKSIAKWVQSQQAKEARAGPSQVWQPRTPSPPQQPGSHTAELTSHPAEHHSLPAERNSLAQQVREAMRLRVSGDAKLAAGDVRGALADLDAANAIQPGNAFTLRLRGDARRRLRDFEGSLLDLDAADRVEPENAVVLRSRGEARLMLDDYQGALLDLAAADVLRPDNPYTRRDLGEVRRRLGDLPGALKDLTRACELGLGRDPVTLRRRGAAKRGMGDLEGARADANLALQCGSHGRC